MWLRFYETLGRNGVLTMGSISFTLEYADEELEEFKRLEMLFDESVELRNFRLYELGDVILEAVHNEYKVKRFLAYFILSKLQNGELLKAMMSEGQ